jgi:hypothetical protein
MVNGRLESKMKKILIISLAVFAAGAIISAAEQSDQPEKKPVPAYVGERKCKVCHLTIFKAWQKTAHANALQTLKEEERKNPICIGCHTTGYNEGGYGNENAVVDFSNVQCEACHGPGSLYSRSSVMRDRELSWELGLVKIGPETCTRCHNENSPTFRVFDYKEFLETGTH